MRSGFDAAPIQRALSRKSQVAPAFISNAKTHRQPGQRQPIMTIGSFPPQCRIETRISEITTKASGGRKLPDSPNLSHIADEQNANTHRNH